MLVAYPQLGGYATGDPVQVGMQLAQQRVSGTGGVTQPVTGLLDGRGDGGQRRDQPAPGRAALLLAQRRGALLAAAQLTGQSPGARRQLGPQRAHDLRQRVAGGTAARAQRHAGREGGGQAGGLVRDGERQTGEERHAHQGSHQDATSCRASRHSASVMRSTRRAIQP
jgi:hypothetical protein